MRNGNGAAARKGGATAENHRPANTATPYQIIRNKEGHPNLIGYARVSTPEQNLDSQLDALRAAGCIRVFAEKVSSMGHRPAWGALMGDIRKGDTVVVVRLDRIGRKLAEVVGSLDILSAEGVFVRALEQPLDTRSAMGKQLIGLFAWLAETERALLVERTCAGLAAARAKGKVMGRPTVITRARIDMVSSLRNQGHSLRRIAEAAGLGEGTVRKALDMASDLQLLKEPRQLRLEGA